MFLICSYYFSQSELRCSFKVCSYKKKCIVIKTNHNNSHKTYEKYKPSHLSYRCFFLIVHTEKQELAYKSRQNLILAFWMCLTYRKASKIKFTELEKTTTKKNKKRRDKHDEIKLHLHREWTIVIFELFVMNFFSSSYGKFIYQDKS